MTGLDYLRARYYDPTLGQFIAADAYQGTLTDPMSLHDYQYAHANPVVNTDPSGYVTSLQEAAAIATLTAIGAGFQYTTTRSFGVLRNGGSIEDAISEYDRFFAGFGDAMTFGGSTFARRQIYGTTATQNHSGIGFNIGRLAGAISSTWISSFAAPFSSLQAAPWWAKGALGYDLLGAGVGMIQSTVNIMNGETTWWDILPFLPVIVWTGANFRLTPNGLRYGQGGGEFNNLYAKGNSVFPDEYKGSYTPPAGQPIRGQTFDYSWVGTGLDGANLSNIPDALNRIGKACDVPELSGFTFASNRTTEELVSALDGGPVGATIISDSLGGEHAVVIDKIEGGSVFLRDPLPVGSGSSYSVPLDRFIAAPWLGTIVYKP